MAGTTTTYKGTGVVASTDFVSITWTGKTKGGNSVVITIPKALNKGNIDWTFAEKDDVVAEVEFTACYTNKDAMVSAAADYEEPWTIAITGEDTTASGSIMLGAGVFAIGGTDVALTRGGGSFTVEREYRDINADGDRGTVEGRVVMDGSVATLKLNALSILHSIASLYPAMKTTA